jgi:hypothetical protein
MRRRRRAIAPWLFFFLGLLLLAAFAIVFLAFANRQGWLDDTWRAWIEWILAHGASLLPGEEWLRYLAWLAGIGGSALGAAFTLFASWHFAEINLPQRLKALKDAHSKDHLALRPQFLALARRERRGLGPVLPDIETSRITLLRKWLSGWSKREQARVLAASTTLLQGEAGALNAATLSSQNHQITAHLIRGYQHHSQGDDEKAFEEFQAAAGVREDDVISRDICAGWARKLNRPQRERELLTELHQAATRRGDDLYRAMALRRQAELLNMHQSEGSWVRARDHLNNARVLLEPLFGEREGRLELGRVLTLFCEVQCSRTVVGALGQRLARMELCLQREAMYQRPEEPNGETYGAERAAKVAQRVAELREDVVAGGDQNDRDEEGPHS